MTGGLLGVTVVYCPAQRQVCELALRLPWGATVLQALQHPLVQSPWADLDLASHTITVWGQQAGPSQPLREGDQVEILRPLKVDPKVARRERFQKQGARQAGLFSQKRAGAKAGY